MDITPASLRMFAGFHASTQLVVHAKAAEEVINRQRAALLQAADKIEQLEALAASHTAGHATVNGQEQ